MSRASATTMNFAKNSTAQSGSRKFQVGQTSFRVINAIKQMYAAPHTSKVLGEWLHVSDRTAKRKLSHKRALSAEDIGTLIRSERGFEIVTAIIGDATPTWWRICAVLMDAADIRKMEMIARRRAAKVLKGVVDADRSLNEALERAETLAFLGQEQAGVQADAMREVARSQGGALAKKPRR